MSFDTRVATKDPAERKLVVACAVAQLRAGDGRGSGRLFSRAIKRCAGPPPPRFHRRCNDRLSAVHLVVCSEPGSGFTLDSRAFVGNYPSCQRLSLCRYSGWGVLRSRVGREAKRVARDFASATMESSRARPFGSFRAGQLYSWKEGSERDHDPGRKSICQVQSTATLVASIQNGSSSLLVIATRMLGLVKIKFLQYGNSLLCENCPQLNETACSPAAE